ncbi:MAG: PDZ domain-containing protein [Candidatus Aureabacteria bacterium]|nr:PDZ domain-containing protein [Candidatus Auribacterota bacterium]
MKEKHWKFFKRLIVFMFFTTTLSYTSLSYCEKLVLGIRYHVIIQKDKTGNVEHATGAIIDEIAAGSVAQKHNLKSGDRIIGVNGKNIYSPKDLLQELNNLPSKTAVKIKVARGVRLFEITVGPEYLSMD